MTATANTTQAGADTTEWDQIKQKEKDEEVRYAQLSFKQKSKKLGSLLSKASAFANFLGQNVKQVAEEGEGGFKQPQNMTGGKENLKMRGYQTQGAEWLNALCANGMSGILADEMGLGKTIQVIALISHLKAVQVGGRFMIVAPLTTLPNWVSFNVSKLPLFLL